MNQNGYCSDRLVAATTRRRRERKESCRSFTCISPRFIFSRFFNGDSKSRNRMGRKLEKEKMEGHFDIERKCGVMKGSDGASSSSPADDSGETGKEASFNLGVGLGLIYLVAASRNEVNKMVEMHKKMEMLLQNFQTEIQNQENRSLSLPSVLNCAEEHDSGEVLSVQNIKRHEIGLRSNRFTRGNSLRMDQLEAELAAEFDRLQLQMDTGFLRNYSRRHYTEEMNFEQVVAEENGIEEIIEECNNEYYAVPPRELERRLHEVLEARQQERIDELESALDYAMQQLEEKERQLSWWKDTARLVSQNLHAIPKMGAQIKQHVHRDGTKILSLGYEKCFST